MAGTYTPIASTIATGSQSSVTFSSVPQTYTDLVLVVRADNPGAYTVTLNADTGSNYSVTRLFSDGGTVVSDRAINQTNLTTGWGGGAYNLYVTSLLDYANTTTYKTAMTRVSEDRYVVAMVSTWRSTAAVSSITITNGSSQIYPSTTTFSLYGIKAA